MQKKIENYILQREIGSGCFGVVYKGKHAETGQEVAVKVIHKGSLKKDLKPLLENEIKVLKCLNHMNCLKLYDVKKTENNYYLILEFCNEGNLRTHLNTFYNEESQKNFAEDQAVDFFMQILQGIKSIHKNNIIHRDLKLDNILKHEGIIKLGDFGFSKFLERNVSVAYLGTMANMAPEILQGQPYDEKVDIWAIGTVFYEMLFGFPPFKVDPYEMHKNVRKKLHFPRKTSIECEDAIRRMLDLDPKTRITIDGLLEHDIMTYKKDKIKKLLHQAFNEKDHEKKCQKYVNIYLTVNRAVVHSTEAKQSEELGNYLIEALKGNKIFEYTGLILEFTLPDDEIPPTMIPISRPDPALGPDVAMLTLTEYQLWIRKNNSRKYLHERNRCIYLISQVDETLRIIPGTSAFAALSIMDKALTTLQNLAENVRNRKDTLNCVEWEYYSNCNKFKRIASLIERDYQFAKFYHAMVIDQVLKSESENSGMQLYHVMYRQEMYKGVLENYFKELAKLLKERQDPEKDHKLWLHAYKIVKCQEIEKEFPMMSSAGKNTVYNFKLFYEKLEFISFEEIVKSVCSYKAFQNIYNSSNT